MSVVKKVRDHVDLWRLYQRHMGRGGGVLEICHVVAVFIAFKQ